MNVSSLTVAGDSNSTVSDRPSASSDGVSDTVRDTTATTSTSESTTTVSTDTVLGTDTSVTATAASFSTDDTVTPSTTPANTQSTTTLLIYGVTTDETATNTPNILLVRDTSDTSATVETVSGTENAGAFDADSVSSISTPMTETVPSTYFMSTSLSVAIPNQSLNPATNADTGTAVYITFSTDVISTAGLEAFPATGTGPNADTVPPRSLDLETSDTVPTPLGTTTACVSCYTDFTSSARASSSSGSTAISGTYTTKEIVSTTQLSDGPATSTEAPTTPVIPELIPRSDGPPCNLAADCSFTAGNEGTLSSDIPVKADVSVTPGLVSVSSPDVPLKVAYPSVPMPDTACCDVPSTDEGQLTGLPDVPLFTEVIPNKPVLTEPFPDLPLITMPPTQGPLYVTRPNVPLPENPVTAAPPSELGFDDPTTDVPLVGVLTPDIPSPAVSRPDLPLLDIPPEVPRLDETPPDPPPTYLSPVDVLTPDVSSTKVPLLDIVPGTPSSQSPNILSEPPLDAVPAEVSVEPSLSSPEQEGSNAVADQTIDQPNSGSDLAPAEFPFPFLEEPKSVNPVLDTVPVVIDDPQSFPDDFSGPDDKLRSDPLDSGQNSLLEQQNTNEKVNEETKSAGPIFSTQYNPSTNETPDLSQSVESIQELDQNKGPPGKDTEEQNKEKGTKCNLN